MKRRLISTPDVVLDEFTKFLDKHVGDTCPMWKLFRHDYQRDISPTTRNVENAKADLNNFVNQPLTIDDVKTSTNGIWSALELLNVNDTSEEDGWLTYSTDYFDPCAVVTTINYYRLNRTFGIITGWIAQDTDDIGGNLKYWADPSKEHVTIMKNEISKLRGLDNWIEGYAGF